MQKPLFVYGTLLSGEINHGVLRGAPCAAGSASVEGALADTGHGYPALFLVGEGEVAGEVYLVDWERHGAGLDELETYYGPGDERNEYERVEVLVHAAGSDGPIPAWTYVYPASSIDSYARIPDGKWRSVSRKRML